MIGVTGVELLLAIRLGSIPCELNSVQTAPKFWHSPLPIFQAK
jgi:hypothetical protein